MYMDIKKVNSQVIGHAIADAVGVPVEFQTREELAAIACTPKNAYRSSHCPSSSQSKQLLLLSHVALEHPIPVASALPIGS